MPAMQARALRWLLIACAVVMTVSLPGYGGPLVLWPWEPFRVCVLLTAITLVAVGRRRWAVIAVCAWAFVASPLVIAQEDRGFALHFPNEVPGEQIGQGVPSGPYAMAAGQVPVGLTAFSASPRVYINGEGGYADSMLVAWSITLLPWPHVDRTRIIGLGGNTVAYWAFTESVVVHRDDHQLLVSSKRYSDQGGMDLPEIRALRWARSHSGITIFGWLLLIGAVAARLAARGPFLQEPSQTAGPASP